MENQDTTTTTATTTTTEAPKKKKRRRSIEEQIAAAEAKVAAAEAEAQARKERLAQLRRRQGAKKTNDQRRERTKMLILLGLCAEAAIEAIAENKGEREAKALAYGVLLTSLKNKDMSETTDAQKTKHKADIAKAEEILNAVFAA